MSFPSLFGIIHAYMTRDVCFSSCSGRDDADLDLLQTIMPAFDAGKQAFIQALNGYNLVVYGRSVV